MTKARNIADLGSNDVIETTSTGVDVTGTVTADGLVVDGDASIITLNNTDTSLTIGQTLAKIDIKQNDPSDQGVGTVASIEVENKGSIQGLGQFNFKTGSATANLNRLSIGSNGDVSFYEDTGTTAKMVWDASAESLILNSTSGINLGDTTGDGVQLSGDDIRVKRTCTTTTQGLLHLNNIGVQGNVAEFYIDGVQTGAIGVKDGAAMTFISGTGNTERARLDSSGNLLVGQTSGTGKLSVEGNIYSTRALYRLRTTSPTVGVGASGSVSFNIGTLKSYNRGVFEVSIFGYKNGGIEQAGAVMHLYMMANPDDIEQPVVISESRITVGTATLSSGILTINFTNNGSFSMGGIKASLRQICEG